MSDTGRPRGGGGAADEVIGALSQRVRELQSKLATLQSELDEAQRKLATYEEFDSTLQDALSGALRAAYEIRSRAEDTATQILEQAREERRILMKEVQRLRDERDSFQEEIATLRRGGLAAVPKPAPVAEPPSTADLRAAAADAMRSVFDEILAEMRGRAAAELAARPQPPAPAPAVAPRPAPPPAAETTEAATRLAAIEAPSAPPSAPVRPAVVAPEPAPSPAPPAAPVVHPVAPPAAVAPAPRPAIDVTPSAPTTEVQLVLSPIPSFPRLVEIERRIQSLPGVRTLYVRDFRNGVATLAVGLRTPMLPEEFASAVGTIDSPRFLLEGVTRNSVELRIESEAATA